MLPSLSFPSVKYYLAPVYDFASKEIVAHSISMCPNLAQQQQMLQVLMDAKPAGVEPILHSDMGWQYQHETYVRTLADNGFVQSMSRKGNCIDNGATEQVFGHIKDEFFVVRTGRPLRVSKLTLTPILRTGTR